MAGLIAEKLGMTRIIQEGGIIVPVTVLKVQGNVVVQVKSKEKDLVDAVLVGIPAKKGNNKFSAQKQFGIEEGASFDRGQELGLALLEGVEEVKITGTSKGKGFQGVMKRHNFGGMGAGHGHKYRRAPGSIGTRKPRRTMKGRKLPGHMGTDTITLRNVPVLDIDKSHSLVVVKGPIPGSIGSFVYITI